MNPRSLDLCVDPDLRLSLPAMQRAAWRAWDIARQTKTCIVVGERDGVRRIAPDEFDRLGTNRAASPPSQVAHGVAEDTARYPVAPDVAEE